MKLRVERRTVDVSGFPDVVVIHPDMRRNALTGVRTLRDVSRRVKNGRSHAPCWLRVTGIRVCWAGRFPGFT